MADHNTATRINRLFEILDESVNTIVLSPSETMRYFTEINMHKSERPTLVFLFRDEMPAIVLPRLEADRVEETISEADFFTYGDATNPVAAARNAFNQLQEDRDITGKVGAEFRSTRLLEQEVIKNSNRDIIDIENAVSKVRGRKSELEIELMQESVNTIENILQEVFEEIEPGIRERDIENKIRKQVIDSNADRYGVGIVTSGERTAFAHTNTGTREVESGDIVMIDAGVVYEGYFSDITRTIAVGAPPDDLKEIYKTVREAATAARETVAPEVEYQRIDQAARSIIEDAGYGEYFPHRVGHGLGLEGHEPPYLVEGNNQELEVGQVVTVEPGVYVPGLGGVRIEDDVVVTETGANTLTSMPRELRIF